MRDLDPSSWAGLSQTGEPRSPIDLGLFKIHYGDGAPASTLGATGDFYFRRNGGGAGATHIYFNNAGWIGIA